MYKGTHLKRTKSKKKLILLVSLVTLLTVAVSGSLAYLTTSVDPLTNTFTTSGVPISVQESFENNVKNNVMIQNDGNTDAYIRAAVVVTWKDSEGNVYAVKPEAGVDYQITFPTGTGWVYRAADGFYYYTSPVVPEDDTETTSVVEDRTGILLTNCMPLEAAPEPGYTLSVEIVAESVQAKGFDGSDKAVVKAWGVDPETLQ